MINIKRYPLLNWGIFLEENHAQFDLKIKLKLSLWTGLIGQDKNACIIIFQMISCREVLYSIKT